MISDDNIQILQQNNESEKHNQFKYTIITERYREKLRKIYCHTFPSQWKYETSCTNISNYYCKVTFTLEKAKHRNWIYSENYTVPSWQPASKYSWGGVTDHSMVSGMLQNKTIA